MPSESDPTFEPLSLRTYLETPENVRLAFHLAGPGSRLGAYLLDLGVRFAMFYGIAMILGTLLSPFAETGASTGALLVLAFALEWGYGSLFETWWNGQTPGKRAFGLRVIKTEGYAIGFYDAMLRNLLRAADFVPFFYAAAFLAAASTERMQRIGDIVAGTMVIRERRPALKGTLTDLSELDPWPLHAFANRFRPSEKTLEAIELLYRRRSELAPARVDEIAAVLADPLSRHLADRTAQRLARERPAEFLFRILRSLRIQPAKTGEGAEAA